MSASLVLDRFYGAMNRASSAASFWVNARPSRCDATGRRRRRFAPLVSASLRTESRDRRAHERFGPFIAVLSRYIRLVEFHASDLPLHQDATGAGRDISSLDTDDSKAGSMAWGTFLIRILPVHSLHL
jgi:hypothetical protein